MLVSSRLTIVDWETGRPWFEKNLTHLPKLSNRISSLLWMLINKIDLFELTGLLLLKITLSCCNIIAISGKVISVTFAVCIRSLKNKYLPK